MDILSVTDPAALSSVTPTESQSEEDQSFADLLAQAGELEESGREQASSGLSMRRPLTKEEERRLAELQDQLRQCLMDMADRPSKETERRIREIEEEIADLTGVKIKHKLSETVDKLPLENDEDEEDEERKARPMPGDLAMELGVRPVESDLPKPGEGVLDFYKQNLAAFMAVAPTNDL